MSALAYQHTPEISHAELEAIFGQARQRGDRREAPCPICGPLRSGAAARRAVLSLWNRFDGSIGFNCIRCGAKGRAFATPGPGHEVRPTTQQEGTRQAIRRKAGPDPRTLARARRVSSLWAESVPAAGTPAEAYLRFRGYNGAIPATVRCLCGSNTGRPPVLLAAAGEAEETENGELTIDPANVAGLIRISLKPDGNGKADVENAKLSLGHIKGRPVWLRPINDGLTLGLCEGVEDTLSLAGPLGIGGWAVGGAGFFEAAALRIPGYIEAVILGEDGNEAGRTGCDKAEAVINARTNWRAGRPPSVRRVRVWEGDDA